MQSIDCFSDPVYLTTLNSEKVNRVKKFDISVNIVKGGIASNRQFRLFPQFFHMLFSTEP